MTADSVIGCPSWTSVGTTPFGIELEVGGVELVALQLEHVLPGLQTFFCQSQTNLLGTHRVGIVVKLEHLFLPRLRPPGDTSVDYVVSVRSRRKARAVVRLLEIDRRAFRDDPGRIDTRDRIIT